MAQQFQDQLQDMSAITKADDDPKGKLPALTLSIIIDDSWGLWSHYLKEVTSSIKVMVQVSPPHTRFEIRRLSTFIAGTMLAIVKDGGDDDKTRDEKVDQFMKVAVKKGTDDKFCSDTWIRVHGHIGEKLSGSNLVYILLYTGCWLNASMHLKMKPVVELLNGNLRNNFYFTFIQADRGRSRRVGSESPACWEIRKNCSRQNSRAINVGPSCRGIRNAFRKAKNHMIRWHTTEKDAGSSSSSSSAFLTSGPLTEKAAGSSSSSSSAFLTSGPLTEKDAGSSSSSAFLTSGPLTKTENVRLDELTTQIETLTLDVSNDLGTMTKWIIIDEQDGVGDIDLTPQSRTRTDDPTMMAYEGEAEEEKKAENEYEEGHSLDNLNAVTEVTAFVQPVEDLHVSEDGGCRVA